MSRKGIHAVTAAALAIARLPLGHVEEDTTLNLGLIRGGTATNIVPESCIVEGEIRSYSHEKPSPIWRRSGYSGRKRKNQAALWRTRFHQSGGHHTGEEEAS